MQDRILNPIGIEESLLCIRLACQGADAFYLAEVRLQEKMRPAKLAPVKGSHANGSATCAPVEVS